MKKIIKKNFFIPKNSYEQTAQNVFNLLVENFSGTYFVGGMVRDLLLNKKISDIDIATTGKPEKILNLLKKKRLQTKSQRN